MGAGLDYFDKTIRLLERLRETQLPAIEAAAELCAERIAQGGLVFLFGAGHSRMMCEEMTPRQGCYVGFFALVELVVPTLIKQTGVGAQVVIVVVAVLLVTFVVRRRHDRRRCRRRHR